MNKLVEIKGSVVVHQEIKYYVHGHTAEGYVTFLQSNIKDIKKIIILQHPSNIVKTKVLKKLANFYSKEHDLEIISSPQSKEYVDGIIVRKLSVAILANNDPSIENEIIVDLTEFIPGSSDKAVHMPEKNQLYEEAYACFKRGLEIHDDLEKIYINEMDFTKADHAAENCIAELFHDTETSSQPITVYKRLFGTNTPDGIVNHVQDLIEPIQNRIFIKGRAGTGKSVFMKKVLEACHQYGYDVEVYHCSFDPKSLDMLIIRDLDCCLFDSTPPHELFPTRIGDAIVDLYEQTVTKGTDEKYEAEITHYTKRYKAEMKKGLKKLEATKELEEKKEKSWLHTEINNFDQIVEEIMPK